MCAAPARPVTDFETKQHKADTTTGELLYNLQVVALDDWGDCVRKPTQLS